MGDCERVAPRTVLVLAPSGTMRHLVAGVLGEQGMETVVAARAADALGWLADSGGLGYGVAGVIVCTPPSHGEGKRFLTGYGRLPVPRPPLLEVWSALRAGLPASVWPGVLQGDVAPLKRTLETLVHAAGRNWGGVGR